MTAKNTIQIIITVLLAIIASALVIILLEKAGVVTFAHKEHAHTSVQHSTAEFHRGEVEAEHKHHHTLDCGHSKEAEAHKHTPDCRHSKEAEAHKHTPDCGHSKH